MSERTRYTIVVLAWTCAVVGMALWLTGCSGDDGGGRTVTPPAGPSWQFRYSDNVNGNCENFDFPPAGSKGVHYCVKQMSLSVGQVLTMRFTLSGNVSLAPVEAGDTSPPAVHLFMERVGDDLSCIGNMQQARYWTPTRVELTNPGTFTLSVPVTPENWSDCYGKSGSDFAGEFQNTVGNLAAVGFTFGGGGFGHGVAGSGHFTLDQFSTGLSRKRRH